MDNFSFEEDRDGFFSSDDAEQFNAVGDVIRGDPGPFFTPHVSREGILSWTNNGGLVNPEPVMIKGEKGDPGSIENVGNIVYLDYEIVED